MMFINNVSDITARLNAIISNLESNNVLLDWNYIEQKAINLRLIEFYKEVIEGI